VVATVGKVDAKKRIEDAMLRLMSANIVQCLGTMLDTVVF
jgi:26S proteasome regulatory subunit N11